MNSPGEGTWKVFIAPSPAVPQVFDATGSLVASLHRGRAQGAADAVLVAHAPEMLNALHHVVEVLSAISRFDPGPSGQIAAVTHEQLAKWLRGPLCIWTDTQTPVGGG